MGEDRQIKFFFEYDPAYRLIGANGVWGGITPRGDVRLDFFVEAQGIPKEVVNLITPEGSLGPELSRSPAQRIVRRIQVGVLLSLEQAESTADFIKSRVADFRAKRDAQGPPEGRR